VTTHGDLVDVVSALTPGDRLEQEHRADTLAWLGGTTDVYRRVPPRTPAKHLVVYVVLLDPDDPAVLLVDHRRSGLWLPAGGHVEPGEHPATTMRREVAEELGLVVPPGTVGPPVFLTVTETLGRPEDRHVDVSLWYVLPASQTDALVPDPREIAGVRWWRAADIATAGPARFDPHLDRFLAKLDGFHIA